MTAHAASISTAKHSPLFMGHCFENQSLSLLSPESTNPMKPHFGRVGAAMAFVQPRAAFEQRPALQRCNVPACVLCVRPALAGIGPLRH